MQTLHRQGTCCKPAGARQSCRPAARPFSGAAPPAAPVHVRQFQARASEDEVMSLCRSCTLCAIAHRTACPAVLLHVHCPLLEVHRPDSLTRPLHIGSSACMSTTVYTAIPVEPPYSCHTCSSGYHCLLMGTLHCHPRHPISQCTLYMLAAAYTDGLCTCAE